MPKSKIEQYIDAKPTAQQGTGSITTTGWVASAAVNYDLELDLAISGVLVTDYVDIRIDKDGQSIAGDAGLSPSNDAYAGGVTFYFNTAPASVIAFDYTAFKAVS